MFFFFGFTGHPDLLVVYRIGVNNFVNNGGYAGASIFGFSKAQLYGTGTLSYCTWFSDQVFTIQPALDSGNSNIDGTAYFISNWGTNSLWKGTMTGHAPLARDSDETQSHRR